MSRKSKLLNRLSPKGNRLDKETTDEIIQQGFYHKPRGPVFVRKAKNAELSHELETGSVRNRAYGGGSHKGKPIFGHNGPAERDIIAKEIGKQTKARKRKKL